MKYLPVSSRETLYHKELPSFVVFAETNVMGPLNRGIYVLFSGLDIERLVLAAGPVGSVTSLFFHSVCECAIGLV